MKKFVYLCGMILLSMNMMAQIDLNDKNWDTVFIDDFSGNRYWDRHWDDSIGVSGYKPLWRCFAYNVWNSGVTNYSSKYPNFHAYQPSNAIFGFDNTMKLRGMFMSHDPMFCEQRSVSSITYLPAPWRKYCHGCDLQPRNYHPDVHYYSGMLESTDSLGYGFYEIECKMPIHAGSHDAFWFWGNYGKYEEIDVFEHGISICEGDTARGFNTAIFYNAFGPLYYEDTITGEPGAQCFQLLNYHAPSTAQPLDEYHTYGCLWMPERVVWYFDGEIISEENDPDHIPKHPMWLKITHYEDAAVNSGTIEHPIWWEGTDEMTINYVKVYRLNTDCNTDAIIRTQTNFNYFKYKVKRSITMGGQNNATLAVADTCNFTMRAVDSITIDGAFEIPIGASMTLITQDCPECSQEGVHSQNYCPY